MAGIEPALTGFADMRINHSATSTFICQAVVLIVVGGTVVVVVVVVVLPLLSVGDSRRTAVFIDLTHPLNPRPGGDLCPLARKPRCR